MKMSEKGSVKMKKTETSAGINVLSDSDSDDDDNDVTKACPIKDVVDMVNLRPTDKEGIPPDLDKLEHASLETYKDQFAESANSTKELKKKSELETVVTDCPVVGFSGTFSDFRSRKHHVEVKIVESRKITNVPSLKQDKEDIFEFPSDENIGSFREEFSFEKFDKNVLQKRKASGSFKKTSNVLSRPWSSHGLFRFWSSPVRNTHEGIVDIVNKKLSPDRLVKETLGQSVIGATNFKDDLEMFSSCDTIQTHEQTDTNQFCCSGQDGKSVKYSNESHVKITHTNKNVFDIKTSAVNDTANFFSYIRNDEKARNEVTDNGKTFKVKGTNMAPFTDQTSAKEVRSAQNHIVNFNETFEGRSGDCEYETKNLDSKTSEQSKHVKVVKLERDVSNIKDVNVHTAKGARTDMGEVHNVSVDRFGDIGDVCCPRNLETLDSATLMLNNCDKQLLKPNICYGASIDSYITPKMMDLDDPKGTDVESVLTKETSSHQSRSDGQDPLKQTGMLGLLAMKAEKERHETTADVVTDPVNTLDGHAGEAMDSKELLTGYFTIEKTNLAFANKMDGTGPLGLPDQARVNTMATIDYGSEMSEHPIGSSTSSRASISESSVIYDATNKISDFDESSLNEENAEEDLGEVNEGNWNETLKSFILQNLENNNFSKPHDDDIVSRQLRRPSLEALLEEKMAEQYLHRKIDLLRSKQLDMDKSSKDLTDQLGSSFSFSHVHESKSSFAKTAEGGAKGITDPVKKQCISHVSPQSNSYGKLTADHCFTYEERKDGNISTGCQPLVPSTSTPFVSTSPSVIPINTYSNHHGPSIYFHTQGRPIPAHGGVFDKGQHSNGHAKNKGGNQMSEIETITLSDDSEHDFLLNLVKGESGF